MSRSPGQLLGEGGPFARLVPGWAARPSQQEMADAVLDALARGRHLVVEAPTGVGKTLGYLVPAVLCGKRVLVSTHTKNLQDQLLDKDLPRLGAALAEVGFQLSQALPLAGPATSGSVRFAVMKGRSNYLCLDRLHRKARQRALPIGDDPQARWLDAISAWAETTERGDRAELPFLPERSPLWDGLDARSEACHGTRCPRHAECFVTRMRQEGEDAELVVVNHHLLFSDLALRARGEIARGHAAFGQVLPTADLLIVDEAHTLEAIAAEHFGGTIGGAQIERLAADIEALCVEQGTLRDTAGLLTAAVRAREAGAACFLALPAGEGRVALDRGNQQLARLREAGTKAREALSQLRERLLAEVPLEPAAEGLHRRAAEAEAALGFVLGAEDPDFVYWAEPSGRGKLGASPVDVARLLRRHLFSRFESVVLTSATLSAGDGGRYFRRAVGVPPDSTSLCLPPVFDYARQAALLVPDDAPEPSSRFSEDKVAEIAEAAILALGGGALFLTTSVRSMQAMHRRLSPRLPFPCLLQGDKPKRALIAEMIERAPAVLFATSSFWEGVDIPGDPLRLVLVDRLPFDVPSDPLVRARGERLEREGKSAFAHEQLPRAILRLEQGFGRLIRSQHDRGAVVLLDGRIRTRAYGRRFLDALPPARRLSTVDALERWWKDGS